MEENGMGEWKGKKCVVVVPQSLSFAKFEHHFKVPVPGCLEPWTKALFLDAGDTLLHFVATPASLFYCYTLIL